MYLSSLAIKVGDDPTREQPGRLWLRNLYHVHQRLCMAFPSDERKRNDEHFLEPFEPPDFGHGQVHVTRAQDSGFLFRIDPYRGGSVAILVQSAIEPDWDYAFHNAGYLLAEPPQVKPFDPSFTLGRRLRFRLLANPTRKIDTKTRPDGRKSNGRRIPVPSSKDLCEWRRANPGEDERAFISSKLVDWIKSKAGASGFSLENVNVQPGYVHWKKPGSQGESHGDDPREDTGRRRSALYEGILQVTDPEKFCETLIHGIGPAKAFGFGLLSVAPCPEPIRPDPT